MMKKRRKRHFLDEQAERDMKPVSGKVGRRE